MNAKGNERLAKIQSRVGNFIAVRRVKLLVLLGVPDGIVSFEEAHESRVYL